MAVFVMTDFMRQYCYYFIGSHLTDERIVQNDSFFRSDA